MTYKYDQSHPMITKGHPDATGFFGLVVLEYCTCTQDPNECPLTFIYRKNYW